VRGLLHLFGKVRPAFEEGGKLRPFRPVYEAMENFFFAPSTATLAAPHVRDPINLKRFMSMVIIALVPCIAAGFFFFGLRFAFMIAVSYAAGGAVEVLFAMVRKEQINEGFLVTGMLFPMILAPGTPFWMVALGAAFGVFVGKEVFGGTGRNLFNPALVGRCFLALAYPKAMSASWLKPAADFSRLFHYVDASNVDAVTTATPLALAKQGEFASLAHMIMGSVAGSIGETSALAIIVGGTFLLLTRVANWRIVASILASFAALAAILHHAQPDRFGSALWHLSAGGLLFGAFFMATDPVTSPSTNAGKWLYGAVIGRSRS
jgi:Na(+)-translocating NADH:ubiquinone oxidoreductase B subunit